MSNGVVCAQYGCRIFKQEEIGVSGVVSCVNVQRCGYQETVEKKGTDEDRNRSVGGRGRDGIEAVGR